MLSNKDIFRELGKNIFIYPLKLENIKAASINLTASPLAWSLTTKGSIVLGSSQIVIPPHDTALIETVENLAVTNKIGGTYHSKVGMVSKGLGHVGTTLDPEWIGSSLLAITNHTDNNITIPVGSSFVSIIFYYLNSKARKINDQNFPGRPDQLAALGIRISESENTWLDEPWRKILSELKKKMLQSNEYKEIKKTWYKGFFTASFLWISLIIILIVLGIIFIPKYFDFDLQPYYPIIGFIGSGIIAYIISRYRQ